MYARSGIPITSTSSSNNNNMEVLSAHLDGMTLTSVYKPPRTPFDSNNIMPQGRLPSTISMGDFNSRNTSWGYNNTNTDGENVENWADGNSLRLIHDPKLPASFNSGRWKIGSNPDLIFASDTIADGCVKSISEPIPHTQHRPLCLQVKAVVTPKNVPFRRRFNFKKANWKGFSKNLDSYISQLKASPDNYPDFIRAVRKSARRNIPRGCRTSYISGLSSNSTDLYQTYKESFENDPFSPTSAEAGELLMATLSEERSKIWKDMIESTDLTHNSREAWRTIKRLSDDQTKSILPLHRNSQSNC